MSIEITLTKEDPDKPQIVIIDGVPYTPLLPKRPPGRPKGKDLELHIARALHFEMVQAIHPDMTAKKARLEVARVLRIDCGGSTDIERAMRHSIKQGDVAKYGLTVNVLTGDSETQPIALVAQFALPKAYTRLIVDANGWICPWGDARAQYGRIAFACDLSR